MSKPIERSGLVDQLIAAWEHAALKYSLLLARGIVKPCPKTMSIEIIDMPGLHMPDYDDRKNKPPGTFKHAGYLYGYTSQDNLGRVYINRVPSGKWTRNKQYIELVVRVGCSPGDVPPGTKVRWTAEDLCAAHLRYLRRVQLQSIAGLRWR